MTTLLLNLRNVPEDEAADVRLLLERAEIAFYETEPSFWGFSSGAIWLQDGQKHKKAMALIHSYQQQRATRMREDYETALREGRADTFWQRILRHPFQSLSVMLIVALILFLTLSPFMAFLP